MLTLFVAIVIAAPEESDVARFDFRQYTPCVLIVMGIAEITMHSTVSDRAGSADAVAISAEARHV